MSQDKPTSQQAVTGNSSQPTPGSPQESHEDREVSSEELLGGLRSLSIRHAGEVYRLILTKNNRLILQK